MRRRGAVLLAACLTVLVAGGRGTSQDSGADGIPTHYRPHRSFNIPVDVARLEAECQKRNLPKPASLQLMYSTTRGEWQAGSQHQLNALPQLDDGKRGFRFTANRDGRYEFAVQYKYPDGSIVPDRASLAPQQRVVIDTTPPAVRLTVAGKVVTWTAEDDNLLPQVELQCMWARDEDGKELPLAGSEWHTVTTDGRGTFRTSDRFSWPELTGKQELYVRVAARDQAGNVGFSPVVRVPGNGTFGAGLVKPGPGPDWLPPPGTRPGAVPAPVQPRITYVRQPEVSVEYTLQKIGRSGVQAAHLYVQTPKDPTTWKFVERFPVRLNPGGGDKDHSVSLQYKAEAEGLYGFYVVAESGAGLKDDAPVKDTPPMMYVVVDWTAPYAEITGVQPRKGGVRGPLVDITWKVADANPLPKAICLEYSIDKNAKDWKRIEYGLDNDAGQVSGRFTWEVPDENLWKFFIRIRVLDKAGNRTELLWGQTDKERTKEPIEVVVDLEKPSGVITGVRGGNAPPDMPPRKDPPSKPK